MLQTTLLILGAYLWGAIPSAYLVGRYLKGIDIRDYGSGNVGASNVGEHVGKWPALLLGTFDFLGKGTLPVLLAKQMDPSLAVQAGVGLAAIAGHNWSPYIRLTGGRGVATAGGVLLGLFMWQELLTEVVLFWFIGRAIFRETGFWALISMLVLPLLAYLYGRPEELIYMSFGIAVLLVVKRLTANWEAPGGDFGPRRVLTYRLLWDRDVPRKEQWTARRPASVQDG